MLSRVADSLYWMARYIERAEHTARVIAVRLESMIEQTQEDSSASWARVVAGLSPGAEPPTDMFAITKLLAFDHDNEAALITSLGLARDNARQVREALSIEVWDHLNRLYLKFLPATTDSIRVHHPERLFREALEELHALEGVTYSTLSHGEGWYFLELGRHIERAQLLGRMLDVHFSTDDRIAPPKYFDWLVLLKFCTAFEPYTKRYTASIRPQNIAEFLLFDGEFPHSVRFSVDRVTEALARVAPGAPPARRAAVERLAGKLKATVDFGQIDELMSGGIAAFLADITTQCEKIHEGLFASYIAYGAETVL